MSFINHKYLHTNCREVTKDDKIGMVLQKMRITLSQTNGIGIAANQVGHDLRLILINTPGKIENQVIINPVVTPRKGGTFASKEGCLSHPGVHVSYSRHRKCLIEGFDENWQPFHRRLQRLNACVAQHLADRINGVPFQEGAIKTLPDKFKEEVHKR